MGLKGFREFYQSHSGHICDKWEQYIGVYDAELRTILARSQPVRMLEIGVQNGGSLELWAQALPAGSEVIGIDIDPGCASLTLPANARVLTGDAADEAFLQSALGDLAFDLIIDDGSHRSPDVIRSFRLLFPRLKAGGRYFIEDLHAGYWPQFGGGFRKPGSSVEFVKALVDALHADHFDPSVLADPAERAELIELNKAVARLSIVDSLAIIEKYQKTKTRPFMRTIAGSGVDDATAEWRHFLIDWSQPIVALDDAVPARLDEDRRAAVVALRQQLASTTAGAEALRAQLAGAEQALRDSETQREAANSAFQAQTDALARSHAALSQSHDALREAHHGLQRSHDDLRQSHDDLRQSHDDLQRSHDDLNRSHDDLNRSHAALRQSHDELGKARDDLRRRLKAIKRSWTWRLVYPARWLERRIRRMVER